MQAIDLWEHSPVLAPQIASACDLRAARGWQVMRYSHQRFLEIIADNLQLYANYEHGCTAHCPFSPARTSNKPLSIHRISGSKREPAAQPRALAHDMHTAMASATWVRQ